MKPEEMFKTCPRGLAPRLNPFSRLCLFILNVKVMKIRSNINLFAIAAWYNCTHTQFNFSHSIPISVWHNPKEDTLLRILIFKKSFNSKLNIQIGLRKKINSKKKNDPDDIRVGLFAAVPTHINCSYPRSVDLSPALAARHVFGLFNSGWEQCSGSRGPAGLC